MLTLNEFLSKAGQLFGFVEKAEKHFESQAQTTTHIAELEQSIEKLTAENTDLKVKLQKAEADAKAASEKFTKDLEAKEAEVKKRASEKAAAIVASQGVPPVKDQAPDKSQAGAETYESVQKQLMAETDPEKRAQLAQKCRELRGHGDLFTVKK
jgi:chromosome segregation ATPase